MRTMRARVQTSLRVGWPVRLQGDQDGKDHTFALRRSASHGEALSIIMAGFWVRLVGQVGE
ncbi:hypothetical protein ABT294_38215 [Nonomuraea sp. NPDC000554]|uniref:hypothetical protein n=1 Tax=Nonomuraea sp. NPDC000554 TaxID=3154259 RepID=UPI0033326D0B